jgi:predicted enzyme related to lactoylglutathione lyase
MIKGVHTMFYSSDAAGLRKFFKDKLKLKSVDIGQGWLIFDLPQADLGVHPSSSEDGAPSGTADISFYCDNIEKTVKELKAKGVKFKGKIEDHGYGFVTHFHAPGKFTIQLYQPKYKKPGDRK